MSALTCYQKSCILFGISYAPMSRADLSRTSFPQTHPTLLVNVSRRILKMRSRHRWRASAPTRLFTYVRLLYRTPPASQTLIPIRKTKYMYQKETATRRRKNQSQHSFLEEHNPTAGDPVTRQPIRIAVPLRPVPVGIRDVPVAVLVAEHGAGEEVVLAVF